MRILLSGSNGFLGNKLLRSLIEKKVEVAILVRPQSTQSFDQSTYTNVHPILADMAQKEILKKDLLSFAPDTFMHMGWFGVENSLHNDYSQIEVNIAYVLDLLQLLEPLRLKRIIGIGSQAEYGPCKGPIDESMLTNPSTLYGIAKLTAFHLFKHFCKRVKIDFTWIRIFSTYGPSDNGTWLIPTLIEQFKANKCPKLTLGEQLWDYLYIDDAIEALCLIATNPKVKGIFNLGSGSTISIREIVQKVHTLTASKASLKFGERPYNLSQIMFLQANIERLKSILSWSPKIKIDEGLLKTVQWYVNEP